jgi:hypothetical protein
MRRSPLHLAVAVMSVIAIADAGILWQARKLQCSKNEVAIETFEFMGLKPIMSAAEAIEYIGDPIRKECTRTAEREICSVYGGTVRGIPIEYLFVSSGATDGILNDFSLILDSKKGYSLSQTYFNLCRSASEAFGIYCNPDKPLNAGKVCVTQSRRCFNVLIQLLTESAALSPSPILSPPF